MALEISCWPLTAYTSVPYKTSLCGIYGVKRGKGTDFHPNAVQLSYNIMKGTEYFVSLRMSVIMTKEYNVMVDSEELICATEHLTL